MEQDLIDYGLSSKEAKLYLLCLKAGEATANRIIELTGMPRGTVYDILEKLKARGLLSSIIKEKTTVYYANDPEVLVKTLEEKKTQIRRVIPKLKGISNTLPEGIGIEVFEGLAGVKKILDDILGNCKELIIMANEKNAREFTLHHPENFRMKRIERKIKIRNLLEESKLARMLKPDRFSEVRHIKDLKNSKEVLIIYNQVTVHLIMNEPITTLKITSEEYTKTQKMLFDNLWKKASK